MANDSVENLVRVSIEVALRTGGVKPSYTIAANLMKIYKIAKSLHKRYENACNYAWASEPAYVRRTEQLEKHAADLGQELGLTVEHQRDPRGAPLKLHHMQAEWALF